MKTIKLKNSISGTVEPISIEALLELFDIELHATIRTRLSRPDVAGMVVFEVLQMDSSSFGHRSGMIYGPGCENKTAEELCARRLGSVPSNFGYPTKIYIKE